MTRTRLNHRSSWTRRCSCQVRLCSRIGKESYRQLRSRDSGRERKRMFIATCSLQLLSHTHYGHIMTTYMSLTTSARGVGSAGAQLQAGDIFPGLLLQDLSSRGCWGVTYRVSVDTPNCILRVACMLILHAASSQGYVNKKGQLNKSYQSRCASALSAPA